MSTHSSSVLITCCLLPLLVGWGSRESTLPRQDARTFILETLRKSEGASWERTGQFLLWSYAFDRSGCELSVSRSASFSDQFTQRIPLAEAAPVGVRGRELLFSCRRNQSCVRYEVANPERREVRQLRATRLLPPDPDDLGPLQNAFVELHQLCRDPYAPGR